jgi:hypothetical protein
MRIVITKNGKIIIGEIDPQIRYKSLITNHRVHNPLMSKKLLNRSKLGLSRNHSLRNTINNLSIHQNLEIEDVLQNVSSRKMNNYKSSSQCKILNIDPNKGLMIPQSMADRYFANDRV